MIENIKIGTVFDERYEILQVLGTGGFGTVYKAKQLEIKRMVALKIIHSDIFEDDNLAAGFLREAQALSKLSHLNIVSIFHVGLFGKTPYLVMEFIEGTNLRTLMNSDTSIPVLRALKLIHDVARALFYVHQHGIIHRDLKPENIMLVDQPEIDTVKLVDFGLAKVTIENGQKLTRTGTVVGTAAYMSPEQCKGKKADLRSDIYTLAVCLFELLKGSKPFDADTPVGVMYKQINEAVPTINLVDTNKFSKSLNSLLAQALAKEPENRFQTMDDFANAIETLIAEIEKVRPPHKLNSTLGHRSFLISALLMAASLVAFFGWYQVGNKSPKADLAELALMGCAGNPHLTQLSPYEIPSLLLHTIAIDQTLVEKSLINDGSHDGTVCLEIQHADGTNWHVQACLEGVDLEDGQHYQITFRAKSDRMRDVWLRGGLDQPDWHDIGLDQKLSLKAENWKDFSFNFVGRDTEKQHNKIYFCIGSDQGKIWLSKLSLKNITSPDQLRANREREEKEMRLLDRTEGLCAEAEATFQHSGPSMTSKALDRACMSMLNCLSTLSQYSKSIHLRECGILRRLSKLAVTTPLDAPEALREDLSNMTRNRLTIGRWPAELAAETRILIASICLRKRDFLEATNSYCEASFQYSSVGKFKEGEQVLDQAQSYLSEDNKQTKGLREFMILYQRAYGLYLQGHKEEALRLARDLAQRWQVLMPNKSKTRSSYLSKTGFLLKELKDEENSRTVLQSTSPVSQEEELNIDTFVPFVKKD